MAENALILNTDLFANVLHHTLDFNVRQKRTCANIQHVNTVLGALILVLMLNALVYPAMVENTVTQVSRSKFGFVVLRQLRIPKNKRPDHNTFNLCFAENILEDIRRIS